MKRFENKVVVITGAAGGIGEDAGRSREEVKRTLGRRSGAKMAGVSRRTFYRHCCDKYELVNWYYDEFYEESFGSIVLGAGLEEALTQCLKIYRQKRSVLKHAYESRDINGLKNQVCHAVAGT